jgi:Asp-tRNA(Asn)/Glu-tRNA(Gln) amidotransferase A subunit family amidase
LDKFNGALFSMNSVTKKMRTQAGFCDHGPPPFRESENGSLAGLTIGVKDLFAIAGSKNAAGNPDWLLSHDASSTTATSLKQLLQAGIEFSGFTHTDELAYSLEGNNHHYGKSTNPKLPGHACGGSSMGSAAATASRWVDVGLGTDTGGSIRVPASYCGLFGIRPSHGAISTEGLIGLAPRFDTVGWFARTPGVLMDVGRVLLPETAITPADTLCIDESLLHLVVPQLQPALKAAISRIKRNFSQVISVDLKMTSEFQQLADVFRILQGRAIADYHRSWLEIERPSFSAPVQARIEMALSITNAEVADAEAQAAAFRDHLAQQLPEHGALFLPTTPTTAPKLGEDTSALRPRLMQLTAIAGLTGSVQIHLPLLPQANGNKPSFPYGFSLLRSAGHDLSLLSQIPTIVRQWNQEDAS